MAKGLFDVKTDELVNLTKKLNAMQKAPRKALQQTLTEAKKRAPGWVAAEVVKTYNIKKAELMPGKANVGTVKVTGDGKKSLGIVYAGRVLTPTHFSMTPKQPKQTYTLKAEIIKGEKVTLGKVKKLTKAQRKKLALNFKKKGQRNSAKSPIMLMHTGNTKGEGGTSHIPFQRRGFERKSLHAIKTVSMPQMVSNERVKPNVDAVIEENITKRLEHYMQRNIPKD